MNIEGLPDSIDETRVTELLASLGIDWGTLHVSGVRITWDVVECEIYATRPSPVDGRPQMYVDPSTELPAMHRVSIPVIHPGVSARA